MKNSLFLEGFDACGNLIWRQKIVKIKRGLPGFKKQAIACYLENGEYAVFPNIQEAKRHIIKDRII